MGVKSIVLGVKVSRSIRNIGNKMMFKDKQVLNILLVNLIDCVDGSVLLYSRDDSGKTYEHRGNPRAISVYRVMKCIQWLETEGYIINTVASAFQLYNVDRNSSYAQVTSKLKGLIRSDVLTVECHKARIDATAVVVFRDENKQDIPYRQTAETKMYENQMRSMNLNNSVFDVRDSVGMPVDCIYTRKFFLSERYNGRMYCNGVMSIENAESHGRLLLSANTERMIEIDYVAMHLNILADMYGVVLPVGDVYSSILPPDKRTPENRSVIKACIMRIINCPSRASAMSSFREPLKEIIGNTFASPSEVMLCLEDALQDLTQHLYSYKLGLVLCNIESNIMMDVVQTFVALQKVLLPVHDSAHCLEEDVELLATTMAGAYRNRMNVSRIVSLKMNKLVDGVLIKQDYSR